MESRLRQRTDGRLDRSRDPVILDAALAVVSENGYDAASMNDIAARAGVGKAAIYRRWSSKAALITDALIYWRPDLLTREVPDTGSLVGDLDALIEQIGRADQDPVPNDLVLRVALEAAHEPGLAAAVDDLVLVKGKGLVAKILAQAAARGEIDAQRDWSMVADVVLAMGLLQVVRGQNLDAAFVRNVIDALVLPALRGPFTA
ncbi:TetR family transcriptional regulator [Mycolicibacter minnesotensis]|uniref:TetR family transcriptional regulator n=1 Tax=Mycolicibacter minnesotensis TaxID=1118379 RepID=A0A7I7R5Z7_9MYCO|nr:TetR/AcrR family transcriptional regulator [Mycolicibacter minnesotensis]ORA99975.1 TetR family transcriptional regulator [Mycolicibacter minnesotensis]BBY33587.1 TetR family transcriptional regulator [Mycolicibacter minnesotensis]